MIKHTHEFRIRYSETDQMGRAYYANYLIFFEVARSNLMRHYGKSYAEFEKEGYFLPVLEAKCRYYHPVGYDDLIRIETCLSLPRPTILHFDYLLTDVKRARIIAEGSTEHCFMTREGKPRRMPPELYRLIKDNPDKANG